MKNLRQNEERAKIAIAFMWISLGTAALVACAEIYQVIAINAFIENGFNVTDEIYSSLQSSDSFYIIMIVVNAIVYIGTAIVFIMWFRRAYWNMHKLTQGLRLTEGWASGAWFVPIYNLWAPYNIATDLFSKGEQLLINNGLTNPDNRRHQIKGYWWAFWIISRIVEGIGRQIEKNATFDAELLVTGKFVSILGGVFTILAAYLCVRMIMSYREMERLYPKIEDVSATADIDDSELLDSSL